MVLLGIKSSGNQMVHTVSITEGKTCLATGSKSRTVIPLGPYKLVSSKISSGPDGMVSPPSNTGSKHSRKPKKYI